MEGCFWFGLMAVGIERTPGMDEFPDKLNMSLHWFVRAK